MFLVQHWKIKKFTVESSEEAKKTTVQNHNWSTMSIMLAFARNMQQVLSLLDSLKWKSFIIWTHQNIALR